MVKNAVRMTVALVLACVVGFMTVAPASAVGIPNKVWMIGDYGHVHVEGKTMPGWNAKKYKSLKGGFKWSDNLFYGEKTSRQVVSATRVTAVGEGRCQGKLYLARDGKDKYLGRTEKITGSMNLVKVYVKRGSCR